MIHSIAILGVLCLYTFVLLGKRPFCRLKAALARVAMSCAMLAANAFGQTERATTPPQERNNDYVGSQVCAGCHADVNRSYRETDMGRSMALVSEASQLEKVPASVDVRSQKLNRNFAVLSRDGALYQSEYELDPSGAEVFRNTQKLAYVMGSGANAFAYLVQRGDYLFEAPLTYYSRVHKWDLSPGYEAEDIGFSRLVPAACVSCHSGRPQADRDKRGLFRDPPFKELAIGCENCHGPGKAHVLDRSSKTKAAGRANTSIVNPAKLDGWMADNICMNCHEGTATRVLQPGKEFSDFRPGRPLDETVAIFAPPPKPGAVGSSPLLEHYTLMKLSKCYRASGGTMHCLTCHDPHVQPRATSIAYYRKKCLSCHAESACKLPLNIRTTRKQGDDCAGCHMPKAPAGIPHSVLTDHRIVTNKNEPLPEEAYHLTTAELPDLVHINAVPGKKDRIPPLTLLRAYGELATADPQYAQSYLKIVDQLAQTDPDDPAVLSALGWLEFGRNTAEGNQKTLGYLDRAIQKGSVAPLDFDKLADLLRQAGRAPEAIAILQKGIGVNPYSQRLYKALALVYISQKRYKDAMDAMQRELEIFPEDSLMRNLLAKAKAAPIR